MRVSQMAASRWMRKTNGVPEAAETSIQNPTARFNSISATLAARSPAPKTYGTGSPESRMIPASAAATQIEYQTVHAFRILWAPFMFVSCLNHRVKCGPSLPCKSRGIQ
jgi:hypothetical protein